MNFEYILQNTRICRFWNFNVNLAVLVALASTRLVEKTKEYVLIKFLAKEGGGGGGSGNFCAKLVILFDTFFEKYARKEIKIVKKIG
jgi:hypothetical protein